VSRLPPAIVLGLDTAVGLVAVRELGRHGVPVIGIGYHDRSVGRGSRSLREFMVRPVGPLEAWLPELVRSRGAGAVLPIKDGEILNLARLGEIEGCRNLAPPAGPLSLVLDKARTLAAAAACGIEVPGSWQPTSADEPVPDLGWPVVLKWAEPLSAMAALQAAGLPDLKTEYCRDEASLRDALRRYARIGRFPLVQSYCPGRGLGQTFYMEGGKATLRFQHERVHEWPPEGGVSSLCRAVPLSRHAEQLERSEELLAALGWEGFAMVEYRFDPATGLYAMMEVNGHLWGSLALSSACGAEFAWEAYRRRVLGERAPAALPLDGLSARDTTKETLRIGRLFLARARIADPFFRPTPWRDLARYLWGFIDPRTRAYVFSWSDPLPSLLAVAASLGRAWRRATVRRGSGAHLANASQPLA
jgi:predicted ATP-grasp superfamily ATP-dependent carboligase